MCVCLCLWIVLFLLSEGAVCRMYCSKEKCLGCGMPVLSHWLATIEGAVSWLAINQEKLLFLDWPAGGGILDGDKEERKKRILHTVVE